MENDEAPEVIPAMVHVDDAEPRFEPYSLAGNKNYTVRGVSYQVMKEPADYSEEGLASWYGKKFHGHKTSNGEVYDMYSMSAAHKTLPLPSYVEVENLDNGKKAIVRVNDRGPFHPRRIIDLSYAAAKKLDMLKTGTAPVRVTLLKPEKPKEDEWNGSRHHAYFVQLIALSSSEKAEKLAENLKATHNLPTHIAHSKDTYRVRFGPFLDRAKAQAAVKVAQQNEISGAFIVTESISDEPQSKAAVTNQ